MERHSLCAGTRSLSGGIYEVLALIARCVAVAYLSGLESLKVILLLILKTGIYTFQTHTDNVIVRILSNNTIRISRIVLFVIEID